MIRLAIWGLLFGAGLWCGIELRGIVMDDRCLDAGGRISGRGICLGVSEDG